MPEKRKDSAAIAIPRPACPAMVRVTAWMWIIAGSLVVLNLMIVVVLSAITIASGIHYGGLSAQVCPSLFGSLFLLVGIFTLRGSISSILWTGIGSFILGGILLLFSVLILGAANEAARHDPAHSFIVFFFGAFWCLSSIGLLGAGLMALFGNASYRTWVQLQRQLQQPEI